MNSIETIKAQGITPKAVIYARFSSDNQREESIEAQLRAINEFCEKNGIAVLREYCDRAKSATTDDRPEFLQMVDDSKRDEFDFVIVHKLDRFSRNRYDSAVYQKELRKNGVEVLSVLEQFDDSPESVILQSVLEGMAEYYSKNLSREVMKGMRETALKGQATGGVAPFGLMVDPVTRRYVINENEAPAVRFIFESTAKGMGYSQVIKKLNEMGFRTRYGKPFGKNSLHEILRNEKYKGVYVFNRSSAKGQNGKRNNHKNKPDESIIRIEGGIEAIVAPEVFDTVRKIIAGRQRATPSSAKEVYLLSGKVFCGECGAAMTGNRKWSGRNKDLYVTYRCGGSHLKARLDCTNKEISRNYLETFVMNELARAIFNDAGVETVIGQYQEFCKKNNSTQLEKIAFIEKKLVAVKAKIDNIIGIMAETGSRNLISAMQGFEKEQEQLELELAKTKAALDAERIDEGKIRAAYKLAREQFLNGALEEKTMLVSQYLNKVVVYKEHVEVYLNRLPTYLLRLDAELFEKHMEKAHNKAISDHVVSQRGGGELARTTLAKTEEDRLSKCERIVLPSAPIIVIIQIGRWCLNYTENNAE